MKGKDWNTCNECLRERQRCREAAKNDFGVITWVCRQCWRDLDFDNYLYEHREVTKS